MERLEPSYAAKCKIPLLFWETAWKFLKCLHIGLPAILLYSGEIKTCAHKILRECFMKVHSSIVYISQKVVTTQMPIK